MDASDLMNRMLESCVYKKPATNRFWGPLSLLFLLVAALVFLVPLPIPAQKPRSVPAEKVVANESTCVAAPRYSPLTGYDEYENGCEYAVVVRVIFTNNHNGSYDVHLLKKGDKGTTGHSRTDELRLGAPNRYVCPDGRKPIDTDGKVLYARPSGGEYKCSL